MKTAIDVLTELLHPRPIPSVRVSLSRYRSYWGAVRYEIRLNRDGRPTNHPLDAACKDRRREHLAYKDAEALAEREGRLVCQARGPLDERDAVGVLRQWSRLYPTDAHTAAAQLRGIPRWTERGLIRSGLSGRYALAYGALTEEEIALVEATERRVNGLRRLMAQPDPGAPDTLGWRVWVWNSARQRLMSPHQATVWHTLELRVERWDRGDAVRGVAGIHAVRMPRDWRRADLSNHPELGCYHNNPNFVIGVVERFGKYVLGTEGWRAEIVVIRKLRAPSTEIGLKLEQAYPEVEVYYEDR